MPPQTSGTYYFPIVIFVIPVTGILHFAKTLLARSRGRAQAASGQPQMLDSWRSGDHR